MPKMPSREGKGESAEALPPSKCDVQLQRSLTEGKQSPKALPLEGECECSMMLQGNPNGGEHKASWPLQELLCKDVLSIWEGPGPCNPGGRPPREHIVNSKRPVEAKNKNNIPGINAHNKSRRNCLKSQ